MKRSSSAPNVAKMVSIVEQLKPVAIQTNLHSMSKTGLSSSNVSLPGELSRLPELSPKRQPLSSPLPLSRISSPTSKYRVAQIKKEESLDERANEREVQEQIILNKTMDDSMRIDEGGESMEVWTHISSLPSAFMSPSSPLSNKIRSRSLTPTSPSSTRTFSYRRSCSPVLRPSSLCIEKRKREHYGEDMDTSPTVPSSKRQQLGFASPYSLSPCVSPLMGNSPLHHSFSRKNSTTQSESTPLSSPSSVNPFALKYDPHGDSWQSLSGSGSACSSTGHSPSLGTTPTSSRITPLLTEEMTNRSRHSNGSHDDPKTIPMDSVEILTETPTPLSPKGLQFRQRPFPRSVAKLQSPIPRLNGQDNSSMSFSPSQATWPSSSPVMSSPSVVIEGERGEQQHKHHQALFHDRLSPFNTELHSRPMKTAKSRLQKTVLNSARQMFRPEPQRPGTGELGRCTSLPSVRLSSPLTKPGLNSLDESSPIKTSGRAPVKRRMSNLSTGSQDDSLMESDDGGCGFDDSLPSTKALRTIS